MSKKNFTRMFRRLCYGFGFTDRQQGQIMLGIKQGLSYTQVKVYADPRFSADQMEQIRLGWLENLSLEQVLKFSWAHLNPAQMKQIRLGLQHGLSYEAVSEFLKVEYSSSEMMKSRKELERSLLQMPQESDTSEANNQNTKFSSAQFAQIQAGMRNKKVAKGEHLFRKSQLTVKQIIQIQVGLENGLSLEQVEFYAHPKFKDLQMAQIRRGFENGLPIEDVKEYANANIPAEKMRSMREQKEAFIKRSEVQPSGLRQGQEPPEEDTSQPEMATTQAKNISVKPTPCIPATRASYFSQQFEMNIKLQHENTWNAWLQSKQVFLYEDFFAVSILDDSAAVERVECEVLHRCPYTSCYIEAQEGCGNKLSFFAVLSENTLQFLPVEGESVGQSQELRIDRHSDCGEMLAVIDDSKVQNNVMKMLQLYVCLCSAEMVDMQSTGGYTPVPTREPWQPALSSSNQRIPQWDVNVYTVTMQCTAKKSRRRQQSENDTDTALRRPHKRRAHWHHFWVGSRDDAASRHRIVKWVSEIDVNPTEDDLPVRIILVKRK